MKKVFVLSILFILLVGCTNNIEQEDLSYSENKEEAQEDISQQLKGVNEVLKAGESTEIVALIKEKMRLGLTKDEVKKIFGEKDALLKAGETGKDNNETWQYDFNKLNDYSTIEYGINKEALLNGDIKAQLFVQWTSYGDYEEQKVIAYFVIWAEDNKINSYYVPEK